MNRPRRLFYAGDQVAQFDESAHHVDADFGGASAVQDGRCHDSSVLGERVGKIFAVLTAADL